MGTAVPLRLVVDESPGAPADDGPFDAEWDVGTSAGGRSAAEDFEIDAEGGAKIESAATARLLEAFPGAEEVSE